MEDSEYLYKTSCDNCGSSDANAVYDDGHTHCFSCGHHTSADGDRPRPSGRKRMALDLIDSGVITALRKRGITEETCRHFGYSVGRMNGEPVQIAPYRDSDRQLIAQHIRTKDKEFCWRGDSKAAGLWGQWLCRDGGKMVVVTEGEIDAMSVSQVQGNKWPVVSIACGACKSEKATKVAKHVAKNVDFLERFDKVVFCFDMDEQGQNSARAAAAQLSPGKAFIAPLPLAFHDANDMLVAKKAEALMSAIWGAKEWRPDGIVTFADIAADVRKPVEVGLPWWLDTLTELTFGRREGEVYGFGAGTGVGKTDFFTQQIAHDVVELEEKAGVIYLEQMPQETGKRIAGKLAGKTFHVPDSGWQQAELDAAVDAMVQSDRILFNDNWGATDWDELKQRIRYMVKAHGVRIIYLDHLTALAAAEEDERRTLERIMSELAGLAQELKIIVHFISHLTTPEGKPHEEGGRVMIRHFKGSRAIGFWSFFMFGLERDQQADNEAIRKTTTLRVLKDRYTGRSVGQTILLGYDQDTGLLFETKENPFDDETAFDDESSPGGTDDDDEIPF